MAEKFIQKAIKKPGALHKALKVPEDKKIPAKKLDAAAKKPGKMGQRARLAETLKKMPHGKKKDGMSHVSEKRIKSYGDRKKSAKGD